MTMQPAPKKEQATSLPPILAGRSTAEMQKRVEQFYFSVASCFELWVKRCRSTHTRRAYREDVMAFGKFLGIAWPQKSVTRLNSGRASFS